MSDNRYLPKIIPDYINNISTKNKIYQNKIKKIFEKILKSDLPNIHDIYLKLKNSQYENENEDNIIKQLIKEIKKNEYTDVQYFILALLIVRLKNIDSNKQNLTYSTNNRISSNKPTAYLLFKNGIKKDFSMNNKINSIIKQISSRNKENPKKLSIILRFIDEYIEVSKEDSILGKMLTYFILSKPVQSNP